MIDKLFAASGWQVVDRECYAPTISAAAIEEGLLNHNMEADYLLFINGKAVGVLDADCAVVYPAEYVKYEIVNSYGILNRITGEPITPAIYSDITDINMLSSELFEVQEYDRYSWYLLDANGRVISKK